MTTPHPLREVKAPLFLRDLPIWLAWRYEADADSTKKPRKVPYYTNGSRRRGVQGSQADVAQLTTFEAAKAFAIANDFTGLGLCLLQDYHITGIDFDAVCDGTGAILPEVESLIEGTYTEYSPSGKGIHAFVKGDLGNSKDIATSEHWGIELFNTKGFLTFTGQTTELCDITGCDDEISEPSEALLQLIKSRQRSVSQLSHNNNTPPENISLGLSIAEISAYLILLDPDHSYDQWIRIGMAVHHETNGSEDGFTLWDTWSANGPKYSSEDLNRTKWESFAQVSGKPITFRSVIKMVHHLSSSNTTTHDFEPILVADMSAIPATNAVAPPTNYIKSEHEFMKEVKPTSWFIKGFLPRATLGVLYGESGSGKSFLALDICASIQRQVDWNGLRPPTTPCRVLYVIAEGVNGFVNRLTAYRREKSNGLIDYPLDFINDAPPNLMDKNSVAHLIKCIHEKGNYDLIVMDTFAQVTPGANENSGEDMGKALGYCRQIAQSSGGMVLLIHHAGKDSSRGVRGWSGLHAAADVVLEVSRFEDERSVKVVKSKDDLDGKEYGFSLDPVVLDFDEDGDPITSCTVSYHKAVKKRKKLSENQQAIVEILNNFGKDSWVSIKNVIDLYVEEFAKWDSDPKGNQKSNLKKSIMRMVGDLIEYNAETKEIRLLDY